MKNINFLTAHRRKRTTEVFNFFGSKISGSIGRSFISCIVVICFFYIAPVIINFANQEIFSNEFQNNSRKIRMVIGCRFHDISGNFNLGKEIFVFNKNGKRRLFN